MRDRGEAPAHPMLYFVTVAIAVAQCAGAAYALILLRDYARDHLNLHDCLRRVNGLIGPGAALQAALLALLATAQHWLLALPHAALCAAAALRWWRGRLWLAAADLGPWQEQQKARRAAQGALALHVATTAVATLLLARAVVWRMVRGEPEHFVKIFAPTWMYS